MHSVRIPTSQTLANHKAVLRSAASIAVLAGLCLLGPTGNANAACSGQNTATPSCTGATTGPFESIFLGDITGIVSNWQVTNGHFYTHTTAVNGTAMRR